jgi:hypothetical protein
MFTFSSAEQQSGQGRIIWKHIELTQQDPDNQHLLVSSRFLVFSLSVIFSGLLQKLRVVLR